MDSVCSSKHIRFLDNWLRPIIHNPAKIFSPYVKPGMTVLDAGCGGGFTSVGLAELVGDKGSVTSVDLQQEMLDHMLLKASDIGVRNRISAVKCGKDRFGIHGSYDFINAFYMVHEVPDTAHFLNEMYSLLNKKGRLFVAEPLFHVTKRTFINMIKRAEQTGFTIYDSPKIRFSRAVVFVKS